MSKEITKAFILQEIQDKFTLREFEAAKFLFSETVIPVYNIETHLEKWTADFKDKSITGTGGVSFFTVPSDEKWTLWRYDIVFMAAGAYTVSGAYTHRFSNAAGQICYLDLGSAKSASYHIETSTPVVLMPGSELFVNVDGYTSTADLRMYIDCLVETIR